MIVDNKFLKNTKYLMMPIEDIKDINVEDNLVYKDSGTLKLVEVKYFKDNSPVVYDELSSSEIEITKDNLDRFSFLVRKV